MGKSTCLPALALLYLLVPVLAQDHTTLTDGDMKTGIVTDTEVFEYTYELDGEEFPNSPFDMHVTLDVLSGDCDL